MKKLKLNSVIALVVGSQIGSGIFLLPTALASLGPFSLFGWAISGTGAILLALVFAKLSMLYKQAGGPHVYVEHAFGRKAAFFTAWTYWLISWVSSITVIIAAVNYLAPLIGIRDPMTLLYWKIGIFTLITWLNIQGTTLAGIVEFFLTILKCIPLLILPLIAFFFLQPEHFNSPNSSTNLLNIVNTSALLTFWGFIGVETATTTGDIVDNPTKTIPKAVIIGTLIVASIYFMNSVSIMGIVHPTILAHSKAPYVDAAFALFGKAGHYVLGIVAFIACVGTLNAWVLTSGQIAIQAAKDRLLPKFFAKTNRQGAPFISLLIAFACTILLLFLTAQADLLKELEIVIDISVTTFLLIYFVSTIALCVILHKKGIKVLCIPLLAALFCLWILAFTPWQALMCSLLFPLLGLHIYYACRKTI